MDTKQFYRELLGLKDPWYVDRVEMDKRGRAHRCVSSAHHNPIRVACPECGSFYAPYDHAPEREFQHLSTCQMRTFVHHGSPCAVSYSWREADSLGVWEPNSHLTFQMEQYVLNSPWSADFCYCSAVGVELGYVVWMFDSRCRRGFLRKEKRLPEHIAVDEKSFAKGHKYETLVCDHARGTVKFVADNNSQDSLEQYYKQFSAEEKASVTAVTMDMGLVYRGNQESHSSMGK